MVASAARPATMASPSRVGRLARKTAQAETRATAASAAVPRTSRVIHRLMCLIRPGNAEYLHSVGAARDTLEVALGEDHQVANRNEVLGQ